MARNFSFFKHCKKLFLLGIVPLVAMSFDGPKRTLEVEIECLEIINKKRAKKGLSELKMVPVMQEIAREHSMKMAQFVRTFGHKGWDSRADKLFDKLEIEFVAENVGFNKGYDDPSDRVVDGWMESRQHKENILNEDFDITGIGVAKSQDGTYYFTQIFASYLE